MCHMHEFVKVYEDKEAEIQLTVMRLIQNNNKYLKKIVENGSYIEKLYNEADYFFETLHVDNT